jgi:hypothetical protein
MITTKKVLARMSEKRKMMKRTFTNRRLEMMGKSKLQVVETSAS